MNYINTATTSFYRNGEIIQFFDDVLTLTEKRGGIPKKLTKQYQELKTKNDALAEIFNSSRKLVHTKDIKEIDEKRDELTIGLRFLLVGLTKHPNPECQKAAERLLEVYDSAGKRIYRLNYQLQTRVTKNLIDTILNNATLVADVDLLKVVRDYIDALQTTNDAFAEAYVIRTQEKGQQEEGEMLELVQETILSYRKYIVRL
ncbi:DUF6261 family protein [Aquimarina algicola]|uniref:Uncharacterized protein n=1 Tax=Aquimarina algicola TaxID=2589995 RepID=A0A504J1N0_9FLAO|nr:DUF6261 family protein [Aquimarina algicola]TPN82392.1 hypothetical protein FHK87_23515 [Aquimarina algicola]